MSRKTGILQNTIISAPGGDYGFINEFIGKMKEVIVLDPRIEIISDNDPASAEVREIKFHILGVNRHFRMYADDTVTAKNGIKIDVSPASQDSSYQFMMAFVIPGPAYTMSYDYFYDDEKSVFFIEGWDTVYPMEQLFATDQITGMTTGQETIPIMFTGSKGTISKSRICNETNDDEELEHVPQSYAKGRTIEGKYIFSPVFVYDNVTSKLYDQPIRNLYKFSDPSQVYKAGAVLGDAMFLYVALAWQRNNNNPYNATSWMRFAR